MAKAATILHGGALGDLVLTLQFARDLAAIARAERVDVISRVRLGPALRAWPAAVWRSSDGVGLHRLFVAEPTDEPGETLRELIHDRFVLNTLGDADTLIAARIDALQPHGVLHLDPRPAPSDDGSPATHIVEQWRHRASEARVSVNRCIYRRRSAARHRPSGPICIHPGSGGARKCWPIEGFIEIARCLTERSIDVQFVLGPAEIERWPPSRIDELFTIAPTATLHDIDALCELLMECRAFLGNDSGVSHLAAWLGLPVVALFGPTDASIWRPLGPRIVAMQGNPNADHWAIDPRRVVDQITALAGDADGTV